MILVAGATGYLGGLIAGQLLQRDRPVRILVRPGSDYTQLTAANAEPIHGDLKDRDSLRSACTGVETVVTTANSAQRGGADNPESVDWKGNQNLIDAACAADVRHYIFVSAYGADSSVPVPFLQAKAHTEEYLRASKLTYTILAPHIFMDVWIPMVIGSALREERPVLLFGAGERKHSFIAAADVAAFALAAIQNKAALDQKLPLGGPRPVSWREIIALAEQAARRSIPVHTLSPGEPPPPLPDLIVGLLTGLEMGDVIIPMEQTARTFGVEETTVEQFLRALLQTVATWLRCLSARVWRGSTERVRHSQAAETRPGISLDRRLGGAGEIGSTWRLATVILSGLEAN